jgi:hypothetical protein
MIVSYFKSYDEFILPLRKIRDTLCPDRRNIGFAAGHRLRKAALTGGKFDLRHATETVSPPIFRLRFAPPQERQVKK